MCITHLLHLTYLISMDATVMVVHYSAMTDVKGELSTYSTAVAQSVPGQHCWNADFGSPSIGHHISTCLAGLHWASLFSVWGSHHTSKRNRMSKNLYMRVSEDEQQVILSTCLYSSCSFNTQQNEQELYSVQACTFAVHRQKHACTGSCSFCFSC